ncbi:hypothetical protein MMC30_006282 [Trapelia coarctata]|nr:hypothetical protein [Trapelia coarctata]
MPSFAFITLAALGLNLAVSQLIDPKSVPFATRQTWCTNQEASCPLICLQMPDVTSDPSANTCDPATLAYYCVCSNGITPNASEFSQTIPFFECQTFNQQCIDNCPQGATACQTTCTTAHPCGAQNPKRVNVTTTSSTMTATSSGAGSSGTAAGTAQFTNGLGGSAQTSTPASGTGSAASAIVIGFGQYYGLGLVFASLFTGFALFL